MRSAKAAKRSLPNAITGVSFLTVLIIKDNNRYMAKCPELDLVTEMDTTEEALKAMVELIREYAEDYKSREEIYLKSPNRAHHKPYVDRIMACQDEWEVMELIGVRYGHLHV
jgi:predicted RNase H-like HicB family nuclease